MKKKPNKKCKQLNNKNITYNKIRYVIIDNEISIFGNFETISVFKCVSLLTMISIRYIVNHL